MKYEKEPDDIRIEENDMRTNRTLQHLRDLNFYKFSVGDVLIREEKYGDKWKVETAACGLPYKYVYVFENELGVGYIRRLSINGRKFVNTSVCVVNFDPEKTRFSLDPSYASHILLASEDDPIDLKSDYAEAKKKREQMHRKNNKASEKTESVEDAIAFLRSLKPNDQLWYGWSIRSIRKDPITVSAVNIKSGVDLENSNFEYTYGSTHNMSYHGYNRTNKMEVRQIMGSKFFKQKPLFFDEIL